jgi:hypothetical protein
MGNKGLPEGDFALSVWSYEAGMLFHVDDGLLNNKASSQKGLDFAKEANPTDRSGQLMLLALRTFKYDTVTGESCSYTATGDALTVVMAYVTTSHDVGSGIRPST